VKWRSGEWRHHSRLAIRHRASMGNAAMSREIVNAVCRTLPGAAVSDPWGGGHDAWKVGGKMFACIGAVMPGVSPYFHRSWVNLPWGTAEAELRHRITASYRLVRASLTRRAQSELAPFERAIADAPDETDVGSCVRRPRTTHRKTG
jgi:predicted DNA-binding protein (MmcQ/YjbR family)